MLTDSERDQCDSNKKKHEAIKYKFFPLVNICHSAYKIATKHPTMSTMQFETSCVHC